VLHDAAGTDNINDFMRGFDQYGGLALNWVVFGSSAHKQRPHGGVLVNYRQCLPLQQEQNQHVKVVANTAHLMTVGDDPHRVYYNDMKRFGTVNELGAPVSGLLACVRCCCLVLVQLLLSDVAAGCGSVNGTVPMLCIPAWLALIRPDVTFQLVRLAANLYITSAWWR
jgi:hypothetical protein